VSAAAQVAETRICWVKIPERPTVSAMVTTLKSLESQLQKCGLQAKVKGIRIAVADKTIRVEVEER
jgi:hypothetical protein